MHIISCSCYTTTLKGRHIYICTYILTPSYYIAVALHCTFAVFVAAGPLIVRYVVIFVEDPKEYGLGVGVLLLLCLMLPTIVGSFLIQHSDHLMNRLSLRLRGALVTAIYRKSFVLSNGALSRFSRVR